MPAILVSLALAAPQANAAGVAVETFDGREMIVVVPSRLPPAGQRALVVVLHGGMGNAERIETARSEGALNMDAVAEANGFIVVYLNGTAVTRMFGAHALGWNAGGGCCGQPAANGVDDVAYIEGAVARLIAEHGIERAHVFGIGHSNGAMMAQRVMCEATVFAAAVAVSGPLNIDGAVCPGARGRRVLAIHGTEDANVPIGGGKGTKGLSHVTFKSEERSRQVYAASGASYTLDVVAGADHAVDHIDAAMRKAEGISIAEKAARFFALARSND